MTCELNKQTNVRGEREIRNEFLLTPDNNFNIINNDMHTSGRQVTSQVTVVPSSSSRRDNPNL